MPTPTPTPDQRAAISHVLLCPTDEEAPPVGGGNSDACEQGEPFVRWDWDDEDNVFYVEEGGQQGTTITDSAVKDGDMSEPIEVEWTPSTSNVSGTVVGAGSNVCTYPGDSGPPQHNGTVETCEGSAGNSGNGPPGQSSAPGLDNSVVGPLILLMLVGALTFNIRRQSD